MYVIDSSSLIESYRDLAPPDTHPGLWQRLDDLIREKRIKAPEEVLRELEHKDDEVLAWVKERESDLIVELDERQISTVQEVLAAHPNMLKTGGRTNRADPFVVALASVRGFTVVTEERQNAGPRWCNIPYVCGQLRLACINMVGLMRAEGWALR